MVAFKRTLGAALALLAATICTVHASSSVADVCEVKEREVIDKATSISYPTEKNFAYSKNSMSLLGAGARRKSLLIVEVNVYSVGLYVDSTQIPKFLKAFKGKSADELAKDGAYYAALQMRGLNKALHLIFARDVGSSKIVDALVAVEGVPKEVLNDFSETLLKACGSTIKKDESITLAWTAEDKLALEVRDKAVKTFASPELAKAIFKLYLGDKPVSAAAKSGFASRAPILLK